MQSDPRFQTGKAPPTRTYEIGIGTYGTPIVHPFCNASSGRSRNFPSQLNGFEFQPSEICPKNFIIFDQNNNKSRIMYHPTLVHKLGSPSLNARAVHAHEGHQTLDEYNDNQVNFSSSLKENTQDIDALLSSGDEEEDGDEDVISTGRTPGYCSHSSSGSSCTSEGLKSRKKSLSSTASSSERKRARMRKMVNALRGIVPGGEQMDTPAILDEAVIYLKSLKMEVKKLGMENLEI